MGLGDRIVVMHDGKVRQIGTPLEIYREPADTFVASFVGSPPMNLLERDGRLLGFRPEHFLPREAHPQANGVVAFPFRLTRVEHLGADRLLYGVLEEQFQEARVIARLPFTVSLPVLPGQRYEFTVPEAEVKFFDRASGRRLPAGDLRERAA